MSLYYYVPNKVAARRRDDRHRLQRDRAAVARRSTGRRRCAAEPSRRARRSTATAGRSATWRGARTHGPANLRLHDAVLGCLRAAGFSLEMTVHAYSVQDAYIYGFALQETDMSPETSDDFAAVAERQMDDLQGRAGGLPPPRRGGRRATSRRRATTTPRSSCSGSTSSSTASTGSAAHEGDRHRAAAAAQAETSGFAAYRSDPDVAATSRGTPRTRRRRATGRGAGGRRLRGTRAVGAGGRLDRVTGELCGDCAVRVVTDHGPPRSASPSRPRARAAAWRRRRSAPS